MNFFKLFPNCLLTIGKINAVIHDLERNSSELIPLDFAKIILELDNKIPVIKVIENYTDDEKEIILKNIEYFIAKDYGIYCSSEMFSLFPKMSTFFEEPNKISNAIVELSSTTRKALKKIFNNLLELDCLHISLVSYEELYEEEFLNIIDAINIDRIKSIEITSKWHDQINDVLFQKINKIDSSIYKLSFFSAPFGNYFKFDENIFFEREFSTQDITSFKFCGKVEKKYLFTDMSKYLESINHNSCLHKKISIDSVGNIRNCPSMPQSFGNIKNTTLKEALNHEDFKNYWNFTKDKIEVCKDCEFRYICTDCRAYTERTHEDKEGLDISKPLKCGYDPYTGEWEEWSTNPLKEKAIEYYGMQELVKKN
ncbi:grasp-with-spasm system SPASM domain peptide maturase [Chryseobacterium wangxinyae]|uniref:grasp-with-spasm system SPASM domain peptide maturase n=1 Tax=Chryseobacterium sp. CY353 TaxID=2997334 RepID=UPI00226FB6EC|nr:grasp-with-spasm system SPASM domain peptide maturase [Chryseobacterium sp. CY353]MCY0970934.1 grasp-with-spasm system SPASM domain peptide maturase [Chryseobacterium sp. CY353]